jgi:predicted DNA-binding transcriptional regulator AlpA
VRLEQRQHEKFKEQQCAMNEQTMALAEALSATFKQVIDGAIREAIKGHSDEDRLIDVKEASKLLGMSTDWIYRNHKKLPFTRKLGPKVLRFSYQGIQGVPCHEEGFLNDSFNRKALSTLTDI